VTVVGRHPSCDIVIDHPSISGRHMLLRKVDSTYFVEDLASTNGTRLNGVAVENKAVRHLDLIELGRHRIEFFEELQPAGAAVPESAGKAAAGRRDESLSRTMALHRDPTIRLGPAQEVVRTEQANADPGLAFRVVKGERRGEVIAFGQTNTMIGPPDGDTALVVRRGQSLFLARFSGHRAPRLNRHDLGPGTHPIHAGDVIEVGGSTYEVILAA
jgi:predicted component of type VI protein secretion system